MAPAVRRLEEMAFRGVLALAGASLGINSYFVSDKVSDISADLKSLTVAVRALELNGAVSQHTQAALSSEMARTLDRVKLLEDAMVSVRLQLRRP